MVKQNQIEQDKTGNIAQIDAERSALSVELQSLLSQLNQISEKIENVERSKEQAKESYNSGLDAGDADFMAEALSRIRQANQERQKLIDGLNGFGEKLSRLQGRYEQLIGKARSLRIQHEKELESFRAAYRQAEACQDRCRGLLNQVNEVSQALEKIESVYSIPACGGVEK